MDFSIFGPYEVVVVAFLTFVLLAMGTWVYRDARARGDPMAPAWAGGIVVTFVASATIYPLAVLAGTVLLIAYRLTHTGSVRLARMASESQ